MAVAPEDDPMASARASVLELYPIMLVLQTPIARINALRLAAAIEESYKTNRGEAE